MVLGRLKQLKLFSYKDTLRRSGFPLFAIHSSIRQTLIYLYIYLKNLRSLAAIGWGLGSFFFFYSQDNVCGFPECSMVKTKVPDIKSYTALWQKG